jgi:hypothetical protein
MPPRAMRRLLLSCFNTGAARSCCRPTCQDNLNVMGSEHTLNLGPVSILVPIGDKFRRCDYPNRSIRAADLANSEPHVEASALKPLPELPFLGWVITP